MKIKVLDQGYCQHVTSWGSDESIIEAARMSTNKGFKGWGTEEAPGDEKLLRYLYENKHTTPFEMAGLTVEIKAPIFVFRQWHRHRTQSYNEMSARYTPLPAEDYVPTVERLMVNSTKNKQAGTAKGAAALDEEKAERFRETLQRMYNVSQGVYEDALRNGVPKELARLVLPVARYSKMRASANLHNWLRFLRLRLDPHAQYEIRVYAQAIGTMIAHQFPHTWSLFCEEMVQRHPRLKLLEVMEESNG